MNRRAKSVSTARQCVALKSSVRIQSRILSLPMTHIYSLFYQWTTCPSSAIGWTLIRRLLDELDVTYALITIDAIGCQHDVAEQVLEAGGHYVLQVKGNQPTLLQELEDSFPNISKGYTVNK